MVRKDIKKVYLEAIEKARGPGNCRYFDTRGACCVAAQALSLLGVPRSCFSFSEGHSVSSFGMDDACDKAGLKDGERRLLAWLQERWDQDAADNLSGTKARMRDKVKRAR